MKVSYCCMPNVASHIASHNRKILEESRSNGNQNPRTCDCQKLNDCPLDGNCMQAAVIYKADITPERDEEQYYVGLSEPPFKNRWSDHCTSFRYERYRNKSKISGFVWNLKDKGQNCNIKWSILRRSSPYRAGCKRCNLCLWEKFHILKGNKEKMINKRALRESHGSKKVQQNTLTSQKEASMVLKSVNWLGCTC